MGPFLNQAVDPARSKVFPRLGSTGFICTFFFRQMTRSNEEQLGSGMRIYIVLGLLNLYGYDDL